MMVPEMALVSMLFPLLFSSGVAYWLLYSNVRYRPSWHRGRHFSFSVHMQAIGWMLAFGFLLMLLPTLVSSGYNDPWGGFVAIQNVGYLAPTACALLVSSKYLEDEHKKYYYMLASSFFAATTSQIAAGGFWAVGIDRVPWVEHAFIIWAFAMLALCDIVFLVVNKWRFLPSHPK